MNSELIQLSFDKIMQTRTYTVIILGARDKKFAIYTEPSVGHIVQLYLSGTQRPRPLTYDLIGSLFRGLDIRLRQVVINDVQESTYFARLFIEQNIGDLQHIIEIDARPSDCIALALMNNAPVYCTAEMLEKTVPIVD